MDGGAWEAAVHSVAETHRDGSNLAHTRARAWEFLCLYPVPLFFFF